MGFAGFANVDKFSDFLRSNRPIGIIVRLRGRPFNNNPLFARFPATMEFASMGIPVPEGSDDGPLSFAYSANGQRFAPNDPVSPNFQTEARLARRVQIRNSLEIRPDLVSTLSTSVGDIELTDQDKEIARIVQENGFDGSRVDIDMGPIDGDLTEWRNVAVAFVNDYRRDADDQHVFRLQDATFGLEQQLNAREYAGTGGLEGPPTFRGTRKPRLWGFRTHFQPRLVDAAARWWQYNDGAAAGIESAYYGGEAVTVNRVDNFADWLSFPLPEGQVVDCPPLGICRDRPAGGLTAPFAIGARGDNVDGYVSDGGDIIARILRNTAGLTLSEYNAASLASLNIGETGFWYDGLTDLSISGAVNRIAADSGGRLAPSGARISAFSFLGAEDGGFDYVIRESEIAAGSFRCIGRYSQPVVSTRLLYRPNDLVLSQDQILNPSNDSSFKDYVQTTGIETSPIPDARVVQNCRISTQISEISSGVTSESAASRLVARARGFFSTERYVWEFRTTNRQALVRSIGERPKVFFPTPPFTDGKVGLTVKSDPDFDQQVTAIRVVI